MGEEWASRWSSASGYTHLSFSSHSLDYAALDDEVSPSLLSLWRVLFNFTSEYFPSIDLLAASVFLIRGINCFQLKGKRKILRACDRVNCCRDTARFNARLLDLFEKDIFRSTIAVNVRFYSILKFCRVF